jgi:hypothetical protein
LSMVGFEPGTFCMASNIMKVTFWAPLDLKIEELKRANTKKIIKKIIRMIIITIIMIVRVIIKIIKNIMKYST